MKLKRILNVSELAIGDIVIAEEYYYDEDTDKEVYRYHPARIDGVSEESNIFIDGNECCYSLNWLDDCDCETVSDIYYMPITGTFLDENFQWDEIGRFNVGEQVGIKHPCGKNGYIIHRIGGFAECTLYARGANMTIVCQYVNEIQHALRIIKREDLASKLTMKGVIIDQHPYIYPDKK